MGLGKGVRQGVSGGCGFVGQGFQCGAGCEVGGRMGGGMGGA